MALRDQPYLPLYIQDIMTDEKLNECSAATHGIFIKGIMCLMHKSEQYGKILLKQKDKQSTDQIKNFALKLDKHLPYSVEEIERALVELVTEKVCYIEGDSLCQKRMINDNHLSELRSKAGKKGAEQKDFFAKAKASTDAKAKQQANTEYENESENEDEFQYEFKESAKKSETFTVDVPQGTPDTLLDCEQWTADVIDGNDTYFLNMIRNNAIDPKGRLKELADNHLALCSRYAWHEKIKTQQAFRNSLLQHIKNELKNNGTERITKPGITGNKNTDHIAGLAEDHARRYGADGPRGKG